MAKNYRFVFVILVATVISLCSCESDMSDFYYIDIEKITKIVVANTPSYQKEYNEISSELKSVLSTVNKLIAEQTSPIQITGDDVDFSILDDLLHMSIENNDGSLMMVTIYILSDDEGLVRCINHSPENIQIEFASFKFQNSQLINKVQSIQSTLVE